MIHRYIDAGGAGSVPYSVLELDGNYNIWRVLDGEPTRLTNYTDPAGVSPPFSDEQNNPRLSPDGAWVVYNENFPDGDSVIDVVDARTGGQAPTRIFADAGGEWTLHPSWHPDSDQIVFIGQGSGGFSGEIIRVQRTDPLGTPTVLWSPATQSPTQRESVFRPQYSPDGTMIAFLVTLEAGGGGDPSRQGLWVMEADGSNPQQIRSLASGALTQRGYVYSGTQFAWSNDSAWIALMTDGWGSGPSDIIKIQPDGTGEVTLATGDPGVANVFWRVAHGAWLPDDSALVVTRTDSGASDWEVGTLLTDGSETYDEIISQFQGPVGGQHFECAYRCPDDDRIYFITAASPQGNLSSCLVDGTGLRIDHALAANGVGDAFYVGTGIEWL